MGSAAGPSNQGVLQHIMEIFPGTLVERALHRLGPDATEREIAFDIKCGGSYIE